jgi:hypothetical protein
MGGPAFYIGKALQALGVPCSLFVSHAKEDLDWVKKELGGLKAKHFFSEKTLSFRLEYSSKNPDQRMHETVYSPNNIRTGDVAPMLEKFDFVIMAPLFYNDLEQGLFRVMKHKKIVLGNFGMFNYAEGNRMVKKHPERAIAVLKYLEWLFLDEEEAKFVAGKETVEEAVSVLEKHVQKIALTNGSHGSMLFVEGKKIGIPGFAPRALADPTGAGDTYLAAFIAGLGLFGKNYEKTGKFAAMAATASIEEKGPLKATKERLFERLGWNRLLQPVSQA